jgi:hypothetical protein
MKRANHPLAIRAPESLACAPFGIEVRSLLAFGTIFAEEK